MTDLQQNSDTLAQIVGRELVITAQQEREAEHDPVERRYRGRLRSEDSAGAYERLERALLPHGLMPLLRSNEDHDRAQSPHSILLLRRPPQPRKTDPRVNFVLFLATFASVFYIGILSNFTPTVQGSFWERAWAVIVAGGPFALAVMGILTAHEFGHYFMAKKHGVRTTLPYFIPMPLPITPFGTLGAAILMQEQPKNRSQLLQIGLAGPIAGLLVTVPVLLLGLALSPVEPLPPAPAKADPLAIFQGNPFTYAIADMLTPGESTPVQEREPSNLILEGNSLLYLGAKYLTKGELLPAPADMGGQPPLLYWVRYFILGQPLPYGGRDVLLHPLAWAGWFGLLVTGLNLMPAGQLDGGHAIYVLAGRRKARIIARGMVYLTFLLGIFSINWWLWSAMLHFLSRAQAEPRDEITPLEPNVRLLAWAAPLLFLLVFSPVLLTGF